MIFKVISIFLKTGYYLIISYNKDQHQIHRLKKRWGLYIMKTLNYEVEIQGETPPTQKAVIVGNHISYLDIPVILSIIPEAVFIAKDDILNWPIIGRAAKAGGTIFVRRQTGSDRSHVRKQVSQTLIERNVPVVVFPSGTTTLDESVSWKKGAFEIAGVSNSPVFLFRFDYEPLRESAYIDDDRLLSHLKNLFKLKKKKVILTWIGKGPEKECPLERAEACRATVIQRR